MPLCVDSRVGRRVPASYFIDVVPLLEHLSLIGIGSVYDCILGSRLHISGLVEAASEGLDELQSLLLVLNWVVPLEGNLDRLIICLVVHKLWIFVAVLHLPVP